MFSAFDILMAKDFLSPKAIAGVVGWLFYGHLMMENGANEMRDVMLVTTEGDDAFHMKIVS